VRTADRPFGPVMQNAFVVDDLDGELEHWTRTMGVGPFFVLEKIRFAELWFRGRRIEHLDLTVAIGYWDDLQIELIRQNDDGPSIYQEFRARGLTGLQHMGVISTSLDEDLARLAARGIEPVQHGRTTANMRFAYVSTDHHAGGMIELIESGPAVDVAFRTMREAARGWDGRDPVRRFG
jgi:hypothetical protein